MDGELQGRIVAALESLAVSGEVVRPPQDRVNFEQDLAAIWYPATPHGYLRGISRTDRIVLADLQGIDLQKSRLVANTQQFVAGLPANNVLLWGSRGSGKSSLVHALLNAHASDGLRIVEVDKYALIALPTILERLAELPWRFILFCDDLSFEAHEPAYKTLKSALDGSLLDLAGNVLIYATSNRRHLLPETMEDNQPTHMEGGEIHHGEAVEEKISLSDRFGLWLSFYAFDQNTYLDVANHWVTMLAARHEVNMDWDESVRAEALRWALGRGNRSGRTANQFARHWVGSRIIEQQT